MKPFSLSDPIQKGINLLEASAGTGKTYTISHIVRDLITGENDPNQPRKIGEILVVTFTKAATEELRDRIHSIVSE